MANLQDLIIAFIRTYSWEETQRLVEEHPQLLTPEADAFMVEAITRASHEVGALRLLERHRALLARCREVGIKEAFAEQIVEDQELDLLLAFVQAGSWQASQEIVEAHPELLEPKFERLLWGLARAQEDEEQAGYVAEYSMLLARCREIGIKGAFVEKIGNEHIVPPGFEQELAQEERLNQERHLDPAANQRLVQLYEGILARLEGEEHALFRAYIQHNLGLAYSNILTGDWNANLGRAIDYYQQALQVWSVENAPDGYATALTNLGCAYCELPTGDRATNLAQAIDYFKQALRIRTLTAMPLDYASSQNNLGAAYFHLPTGDHNANLAQAIECYQEALRVYTPENKPREYGMTYANLGNAYYLLKSGDRSANLSQAIACFKLALSVQTPQSAPLRYASHQHNLGNAYFHIPTGDQIANLRQAIACYEETLRFATLDVAPYQYAISQYGLGNAYQKLPVGDEAENMARAIACYHKALQVYTPESAPREYGMTQNSLGGAYTYLPADDRGIPLAQAIDHFQEALRFYTLERAPLDYAMIQANLGCTYALLPPKERRQNLSQAITCFENALRVYTPETAPYDYRQANGHLGTLHFYEGNWQAAFDALQKAIVVGERLYRAGLSAENKATEIASNAKLYRRAAFAAARLGDATNALLLLERGKTRLLSDALRLRIPRPLAVPDELWRAFLEAGAALRATLTFEAPILDTEGDPIQTYANREKAARAANAALDATSRQIRDYASDFLSQIDLLTIHALLPSKRTALITFCITEQGSLGFLLSRHNSHHNAVQLVDLPDFTSIDLRRLLIAQPNQQRQVTDGFLGHYTHWLNERRLGSISAGQSALDVWQATITDTLTEVGQAILTPILAALPAHIERLIFLPFGGLFVLPLHAVPLSDREGRVCDHYQVSYAPFLTL